MTARLGSAATAKVIERVTGPKGVNASLAALTQADRISVSGLAAGQVSAYNAAAEIAERTTGLRYPAVCVYCEKLTNSLTEKFRKFSGTARMAVEIRHSEDRLEELQGRLELYADAVAQTLNGACGDWGDGMYYAGGYEVAFGAVKRGGRNFIQPAKITFEIEVSRS